MAGFTRMAIAHFRNMVLYIGVQAGAPISVLSSPAMLMLAQLQRHTRNDVLITLSGAMDLAVELRLVRPETRVDGFANEGSRHPVK